MNNPFFFNVTETITNLPDGDEKERTLVLKKTDKPSFNPKINPAAAPVPTSMPSAPLYTQYSPQPIMSGQSTSYKAANNGKTMIYVLGGFLIVATVVIVMLIIAGSGKKLGEIGKELTFDQYMTHAIERISDSDYQGAQSYLQAAKEKLDKTESEENAVRFEFYNNANSVFLDVDKLFDGSDHTGEFAYDLNNSSVLYPETDLSFDDDVEDVLNRLRGYSGSENEILSRTANREIAYITVCSKVTHSYDEAWAIGLEFSFDDIKRLYNNQFSQTEQNRDFDNFNSAVKYIQRGIDDLSKGDISTAKGYCFGDDKVFSQMVRLCNALEKFDSFKNVKSSLQRMDYRGEDTIIEYNREPLEKINLYIDEGGVCGSCAKMYRDKAVIMCMTNCEKLADEIPRKADMYQTAYRYYISYCKENDINIQVNQIQTSQQG